MARGQKRREPVRDEETLIQLGLKPTIGRRQLRKLIHEKLGKRPDNAPPPVSFSYVDDEDEVGETTEVALDDTKWQSPSVPWAACDDERRAWLRLAWGRGELSWKLTPSQQDAYAKYDAWRKREDRATAGRIFALDSSRRWGKSAILLTLSMEDCIRAPFPWREVYCAPTWEQVKRYIFPIHAALVCDCPPELEHVWRQADRQWTFPRKPGHDGGSVIDVVGLDTNPDGARGSAVDGGKLDEAGFFDNLEYLIHSVLYPQMLGRDWARLCAGSTPPRSPGHHWSTTTVVVCQARGAYDKKTLDDADQYTAREKEEFWNELGGRTSAKARREFGAEHIVDEHLAIVPEFREVKAKIVVTKPPPIWRDCYTILDPGWHDMSGVLFFYWDFDTQKLYIEDELCEAKQNSDALASKITSKEDALWKGCYRRGRGGKLEKQPYKRYADNDPRLVYDLHKDHDLAFQITARDGLLQHVDNLRVAIQRGDIEIHPRCRKLIAQLENGVWKRLPGDRAASGKRIQATFGREGEDFGHFDLVACLVYGWRNVEKRRNPQPDSVPFIAGRFEDKRVARSDASKWHKPIGDAGSRWYKKGKQIFIRTGATKHE